MQTLNIFSLSKVLEIAELSQDKVLALSKTKRKLSCDVIT